MLRTRIFPCSCTAHVEASFPRTSAHRHLQAVLEAVKLALSAAHKFAEWLFLELAFATGSGAGTMDFQTRFLWWALKRRQRAAIATMGLPSQCG